MIVTDYDWQQSQHTGNYILFDGGEHGVTATVFEKKNGTWGGVWNSPKGTRFTKKGYDDPEEAQRIVERGIEEGADAPLWAPDESHWRLSRPKKGRELRRRYWRRGPGGVVLAVSETRNAYWVASAMGEIVCQPGTDRPIWYETEAEAAEALDARYEPGAYRPLPTIGSL